MKFRQLAFLAACVSALSAPAYAETHITVLHVSENAAQKAVWNKIADDYNAAHPGVKVEFKYLENEAFKAKLPTMLQSDDSRPELFYSWGGGVMQAQDKAGFLKDITAECGRRGRTRWPRPRSTPSRSTARSSACRSRWARSSSTTTRSCSRRPA